jgi:YaaC-like Protein
MDWHKCRFLESYENLKPLVKRRFGRTPSTSIAREIVACLQQGRLFYEAAESSPLEIRPLQLFYGMIGFSKALIVAQRLLPLSTLVRSHGICEISEANTRIQDLRVKIGSDGTFQAVNDVVAPLTRLSYQDGFGNVYTLSFPSAMSQQLQTVTLSLRGILSRIANLQTLYRMTFAEDAAVTPYHISRVFDNHQAVRLQFDNYYEFTGRDSLRKIVSKLRERFPFLNDWALESARNSWDQCDLWFTNLAPGDIDEFSEQYSWCDHSQYQATNRTLDYFVPEQRLSPGVGYLHGGTFAVAPLGNAYLSEYTLHYLGLFLLSSLVRYRPYTWASAISKSNIDGQPPDDRALSLIEKFLELNGEFVPNFVIAILNPHEDFYFGGIQFGTTS